MIKRLGIYFREMYPLASRLGIGFIVFLEIYFIILLNSGVTQFQLGIQEVVGGLTVFFFLMFLRIADDFKDYETDKILFPERALPSGKVTKKDLKIVLAVTQSLTFILNLVFMNNFGFYLFLFAYGLLMSVWFFHKSKIQKSLPLALVTHNPVQMVINIYIISFTLIKYQLPWQKYYVILTALTLYFPALIWEIGRKTRAPEEETEYTTYSKLFGVAKTVRFLTILTWVDICTNILLVWNLNQIIALILFGAAVWMTRQFVRFVQDPTAFPLIKKIEQYTFVQEGLMLLTVVLYLTIGRVGL